MINSDFPLKDLGISNALETGELPRHRWYFMKEGFSPKLIESAIQTEGVRKGELLIDPFSGSGTVPVTGASVGLKTVSYEVNPFLRFLSSTKLLQTNTTKLQEHGQRVIVGINRCPRSPLEGYSTFGEGNRWNRWLFNTSVLRGFEGGSREISRMPYKDGKLLKLALIGAALDCCNAARDGKCLRYKKDWRNAGTSHDDLVRSFKLRLKTISTDIDAAPLDGIEVNVIQGDVRKHLAARKEKFRLCVTSPPYLNSFDYSDVYRPELFLGGFVDSTDELMRIRLKTVRSHVQASWRLPKRDDFGSLYADCIKKVKSVASELWDPRLPTMVQAFFEDMETILGGLHNNSLPNASVWLVVSTSAYGGIEVPVDLILAEIGQRKGWFLREIGVLRHLRSSGQHMNNLSAAEGKSVPLRESVIIFDRERKTPVNRRVVLPPNQCN